MNELRRERAKGSAERRSERRRRCGATWISSVAGGLGATCLGALVVTSYHADVLEPAAAFTLATGIVAGMRALDGPIRAGARLRPEEKATPAFAALKLWLGCFAAIWAALAASHALFGSTGLLGPGLGSDKRDCTYILVPVQTRNVDTGTNARPLPPIVEDAQ